MNMADQHHKELRGTFSFVGRARPAARGEGNGIYMLLCSKLKYDILL